MTLWFKKKGLWEIVDGTEKKPERPASSSRNRWSQFMEDEFLKSVVDWDIQNMKALSAIAESLTKEVSPLINNLSAHAAWTALVDYFDRDSTMRAVTLLGQLFSLTFPPGSSMQAFLMKIKVNHDQLLAMNSALTGTQLAALVLVKLPADYDSISQSLRLQVTKNKLEFDDLSSLLIEEETVLISKGKVRVRVSNTGETADSSQVTKKGKGRCYKCGKRGHLSRDCKSIDRKSKKKSKDTSKKKQEHDHSSSSESSSESEGTDQAKVAAVATSARIPAF